MNFFMERQAQFKKNLVEHAKENNIHQQDVIYENTEVENVIDGIKITPISTSNLSKQLNEKTIGLIRNEKKENAFTTSIASSLAECYYNSLVFDESYLHVHKDRLINKGIEFFSLMQERGFLNLDVKKNKFIQTLVNETTGVVNKLSTMYFNNTLTESIVDQHTAILMDTITEEGLLLSKLVREKVEYVIKSESEYITRLQEDGISIHQKYNKHHTTSLMESISRMLVEKVIIETTNDNIDAKELFGETIEYYTLLEFINTAGLTNFDSTKLNNLLRMNQIQFEDLN